MTLLHDRVDDAFLDAAGPQLRVVANVAVGYNNIDVAACTAPRRARHEHARRAHRRHGRHRDGADPDGHAPARRGRARDPQPARPWRWHMHYHARHGPAGQDARHRRPRPDRHAPPRAARAPSAWRSSTAAGGAPTRRSRPSSAPRFIGFDELLATSDVVSLHCPLTTETHHLITAERLRADAPRRLPRQHDARPRRRRGGAGRGAARRA